MQRPDANAWPLGMRKVVPVSDTLVIMRHGKAQRPVEGLADIDRELTEAGKRALRATLPRALTLIPNDASVHIWSSPAVRADQTAQIVLRACKQAGIDVDPDIEYVDALWRQDIEAFRKRARTCNADIVLAVGHNPFVEEAVQELAGSLIDIATGGFAAIALSDENAQASDIQTAVTGAAETTTDNMAGNAAGNAAGTPSGNAAGIPSGNASGNGTDTPTGTPSGNATDTPTGTTSGNTAGTPTGTPTGDASGNASCSAAGNASGNVAGILTNHPSEDLTGRLLWFVQGPKSQQWKTLACMEDALKEAADAVKERCDAFLADPEDIETMHKLRVSIRTLRSLIAFASPWLQSSQAKACQSGLKRIMDETSRQRELDVLAEQTADMEGAPPELPAFCARQAADHRAQVLRKLSSKRTLKLLDGTLEDVRNLRWRKAVEAKGLDSSLVREQFDKLAASFEANMAAHTLADEETTHDVRKDAKRARYVAERFKPVLGDDAVAISKQMTAHQDDLGAICDARNTIRLIREFESSELAEPVAWGLALLRAQNETFLYKALFA